MELALQIISIDETVRSNTVQDLKDFNSQSFATQAKRQEQLISSMPSSKTAFDLMADDIVEISTQNESLKKNRLIR